MATMTFFLQSWQGAAAASITLSLWEEEQPDIQAILDEAIARFEKAQKDIKVRRSHFKTEDLRVQFQTASMAGKGADLVLAPNDFAGVFSTMGVIQPVDKFGDMQRFSAASRTAITDAASQSWGIPINLGNHLMLFVDRAKIKTPPTTLEDLVQAAKKFTNQRLHQYGFAYHSREPFWFVPFISAFGARPLVGNRPNLNTPATEAALQWVRSLKFEAAVTPPGCDYTCAETLFIERKAAMTINGDWAISKFHAALQDDLLIAPLPRSAVSGQWAEPMVSGKYLLFPSRLKGERLAAAQTFAAYMTSPAIQVDLAKRSKRLPALAHIEKLPLEKSRVIRDDPLLAASLAALAHCQPMPMAVQMRAVWDAIRPQLQEVMAGRREPKAAVAIMQKDAQTKIRDMAR